jgi:hypothetical protein
MLDNISIKAMTSYERATKGNAFDLFKKEDKTATDLVWLLYMVKYSKDNTVTFEAIENLSAEQFAKEIASLNEQPATNSA